jgi:hypothetical protein
MKTRDTNKLLMFLAVVDHCTLPENSDAVTHLGGFALAAERLQLAVEGLQDRFSLSLQLDSTASSDSKASILSLLAGEAANLSGGFVTWAKVNGHDELASQAHLTRSSITGAREVEAADWVDGLLIRVNKAAETEAAALADYGVTAELIDNVTVLHGRFSAMIGRPRSIIQARKRANESIPIFIAKADEQLAHLDRLAPLLEKHHPEFVATFRDKRKTIHFAASRSLSEQEKANAEVRAAKEELLDAEKAVELAQILVKRDATLAKARQLRASLAASKAGEVSGSDNGSNLPNRKATPIPAHEDPEQLAKESASGLVA